MISDRPFKEQSRVELLALAKSYKWVHMIDLGDGVVTPGDWGHGNPQIHAALERVDFRGKRVLDIGCWDGQWSFLAEDRGASEVWATDLMSQRPFVDQYTFEVAAALRGSKAHYVKDLSVYDAETLGKMFDIVLYMGIYYHLKDPIRALTCLRRVMNEGAQIVIEGAVLDAPGCFANFYYREPYFGDNSNWWVPTRECLKQWTECSFMDVQWEGEPITLGLPGNHRGTVLAQAVSRHDPLYLRVPEDLEQFNR